MNVGDTVEWRWKFAQFITGMKVQVVQVKGLLSQEEEEGGFNSGPATSEGEQLLHFGARVLLCKTVCQVLVMSRMIATCLQ